MKKTIKLSKLNKDTKNNQKDNQLDNQSDNQKDNQLDNQSYNHKNKKDKQNKSQKIIIFKKEYIESKTKGISKEEVFRKNSNFYKDNELIICMVLREKIYSYKCMSSGCQVKNDWNNKPLYLLLNRKNKKRSDLSIDNLEFQCPNCFMQNNGSINWQKEIKEIVIYCQKCNNYPVNNLPDYYKINKICKMCNTKINDLKKTNLDSLSILQEACGNSGMISIDNSNTNKSKAAKDYNNLINDDSLEKVIGDYQSNQPYFNINSTPKKTYSNQNDILSNGENGSKTQQNDTINRLSHLNLNCDLEDLLFTKNIEISQLTKDIETIAESTET